VRAALQILIAVLGIAGLLTLNALALYAIYRVVMVTVSFIPAIGKKHRHRDWDRLNRG
jgi:ABC-type proline/glycine betaine transport system permease subunit